MAGEDQDEALEDDPSRAAQRGAASELDVEQQLPNFGNDRTPQGNQHTCNLGES